MCTSLSRTGGDWIQSVYYSEEEIGLWRIPPWSLWFARKFPFSLKPLPAVYELTHLLQRFTVGYDVSSMRKCHAPREFVSFIMGYVFDHDC